MIPLPENMRAIVVDRTGDSSVLRYAENEPLPRPSSSEVLIKNVLAGVNYIDVYYRSGLYQYAHGCPMILGQECVGTIIRTPDPLPYGLREGDEVIWMHRGGYAEYSAVPVEHVVKLPSNVPKELALASYLSGLTALVLVKESFQVKKGQVALVHAAAGSVGLLLCRLLKHYGVKVIGTASTEEKCSLARENGTDFVVNYKEGSDWIEEVKKIVSEGSDVVYDSVGASTWKGSLEVVKKKGTVVFFGNSSGPVPPFDIQRLAQKNIKITRAAPLYILDGRSDLEDYAGDLFDLLRAGVLQPRIHKIYDLKDVQQAHKDIEGRSTMGKTLLKL